ncbi:hypothetical protein SAMN05428977_104627 [Nitrosomonas sp. Nm166]|nr:hypothetical protein SAMN05428977_104627 [Nitrosomonas sp. Nm166]
MPLNHFQLNLIVRQIRIEQVNQIKRLTPVYVRNRTEQYDDKENYIVYISRVLTCIKSI